MLTSHPFTSRRRSAGFSIVELMVGVVIALLGSLIIFQVFAVSEGYKRSTTGGGDAQTTGMVALYQIERDVRQAGQGYSDLITLGARLLAAEADGGGSVTPVTYGPLNPVTITRGPAGRDQIEVLIQGPQVFPGHGSFGREGTYNPAVAVPSPLSIQTSRGFLPSFLVAICQPNSDCILRQVSAVGEDADGFPALQFGPGTVPDANNNPVFLRFNPPTWPVSPAPAPRGDPPAITGWPQYKLEDDARVYPLGEAPPPTQSPVRARLYSIDANNVLSVSAGVGTIGDPIAENVMSLQAQYGLDTTPATATQPYGDGTVDVFVDPNSSNFNLPDHVLFTATDLRTRGAAWRRVLAVRIAIVTRGNLQEKTQVTGATLDLWPGRTWTVPNRYFRYKAFETIVPVRTMLWARNITA